VIEEASRYSRTAPTLVRTTTVDALVLGAVIPKSTEVLLLTQGPSVFSPAFLIDDKLRSAGYLAANDRIGSWDSEDIGQFIPEQWLQEEKGNMVFDPTSGPLLAFGLGPRGCFGRRLAYLEARIMVVALVWGFELQKCPEELSGSGRIDGLTSVPAQCYIRLKKL
jgi:cytochrome P450